MVGRLALEEQVAREELAGTVETVAQVELEDLGVLRIPHWLPRAPLPFALEILQITSSLRMHLPLRTQLGDSSAIIGPLASSSKCNHYTLRSSILLYNKP